MCRGIGCSIRQIGKPAADGSPTKMKPSPAFLGNTESPSRRWLGNPLIQQQNTFITVHRSLMGSRDVNTDDDGHRRCRRRPSDATRLVRRLNWSKRERSFVSSRIGACWGRPSTMTDAENNVWCRPTLLWRRTDPGFLATCFFAAVHLPVSDLLRSPRLES